MLILIHLFITILFITVLFNLYDISDRVLNGVVLRLGWGKSIAIPPNPIYMPPKLAELVQPQPPTGLPFSCALSTPSETKDARAQFEANPHSAESEKVHLSIVPFFISFFSTIYSTFSIFLFTKHTS